MTEPLRLAPGLVSRVLTRAWAASRRASVESFDEASRHPRRAQEQWLSRALPSLGGSTYGKAVGLDGATSLESVRRAPIVQWDDVAPWVERLANGEQHVLTTEQVLVFERTSGSTTLPKRVPYTQGLLDDFSAATGPWLDDVFRTFPALFRTRQYWSVSPAVRAPETTPSGLRVGFEDDTEYFGPATRFAMKQLMAVPSTVTKAKTVERWRDETLLHLIEADDLGFISVWNPSFLTVLLEALLSRWTTLESRLSPRRRVALQAALERSGGLSGETLWPSLQLISCWTDAWAAEALPGLRRFFPRTPLQGKGLLATEGVVSFPLWGQPAPVAAVTSHLLEFEALEDAGRPARFIDELRAGAAYSPILTTRGGLVRYRLPDVVRCVGFWRALPLLRFEGRLDKTSDLRGEKLSSVVVESVLRETLRRVPVQFVLLAPSLEPTPRYVLFLESDVDDVTAKRVAESVERGLLKEYHYRYCRELGQLEHVTLVRVKNARPKWLAAMQARGMKLGDIKPAAFDTSTGWESRLD
ncbi:MAG: GH3 auxin-responsive promoter family protein [Archangiaceae bacterium]|nr:GH3 auxin-responsive promoter family protein [Archangiaceae bacterium]